MRVSFCAQASLMRMLHSAAIHATEGDDKSRATGVFPRDRTGVSKAEGVGDKAPMRSAWAACPLPHPRH